jgi:sugar (pentulose or hexulose) kinase
LDKLTLKAKSFTALINPDDASFYNPKNMEAAIAEFCKKTKQPVPKDRGTSLRVVYESLALRYRYINETICRVCGKPSRVVHIVGGGSKNVMLNQATADAINLPVLAGPEECTAVGNFMVQAMGLGIIPNMASALPYIRSAFPIKEYTPCNSAAWNTAYERFKRICKN